MSKYSTADHAVLKSIVWDPEKPAERVNDHILMSKSTSNSYLISSDQGDVIINTGTPYQGERTRERFEEILGRPVRAEKIVFTQSHPDHIGGWAAFADGNTETVVQREFPRICQERKLLARYFQPRAGRVLNAMMPKKEHSDAWYKGTRDPHPLTLFADYHQFSVGGRLFELHSTPSGETLDALIVWMPAERTLFIGNLFGAIQGALPNFYTARGDRDRSVAQFFRDMDLVLMLRPELFITGHDEPIAGAENIHAYLTKIRDAVRYIHDETVKGMNEHKDMWTLMQEIQLPGHLKPTPGRGPVSWYVRSVWEEYTGWFRSDLTSELYSLPPQSIWPQLATMAGGVDALIAQAQNHLDSGHTVQALHFIEIAIAAEPSNKSVRETEVSILEKLIEENGGLVFDELGWLENAIKEAREAIQDLQDLI